MARLLQPSSFGLIALGFVFVDLGKYFSQLGLSQAIIYKKELKSYEINTAIQVAILTGLVFSFTLYLLSGKIASFSGKQELDLIIKILSALFIINGFSLIGMALLRKKFKFKKLMIIESSSNVVGYFCFGIPLALLGFGVYSLVAASIVIYLIRAIYFFYESFEYLDFDFKFRGLRSLVNYGGKISIISFFEYLSNSLPTFILGKLSTSTILGYFNRAYKLSMMPGEYITTSFTKVLFPTMTSSSLNKDKNLQTYFLSKNFIMFIVITLMVVVSVHSEVVVNIFLGIEWEGAIIPLKILSVTTVFYFASHFSGVLCDSEAKLNPKLFIQILYCIILITLGVYIGHNLTQLCLLILSLELLKYISYVYVEYKIVNKLLVFKNNIIIVFYLVILYVLIYLLQTVFEIYSPILNLLIGVILSVSMMLLYIFIKPNRNLKTILSKRLEALYNSKLNG